MCINDFITYGKVERRLKNLSELHTYRQTGPQWVPRETAEAITRQGMHEVSPRHGR